ncbi:MAG: hypothetical protein ACRDRK_16720 [Pseudonocardia sp.]
MSNPFDEEGTFHVLVNRSYSAALVGVVGAWPVGRPPGVSA